MCLDKKIKKPFFTPRTGYKVFQQNDQKQLFGSIFEPLRQRRMNEWLDEFNFTNPAKKKYIEYMYGQNMYERGWHVFLNKKDAEDEAECCNISYYDNYVVRKVKMKEITSYGKQSNDKIAICNKIFIIGKRK